MRQVNFVFGETLEISTTVRDDGSIQNQEIVSSGPDALITFKIDREAALTPKMLRELADRIEGPRKTWDEIDDDYDDDVDNSMTPCKYCGSPYCSGVCRYTKIHIPEGDCPF
jgi:hypothetical protein